MKPTYGKLFLIRGPSGSGKGKVASEVSDAIREAGLAVKKYEAHDYFNGKDFDRDQLTASHTWCRAATKKALLEGVCVVVSNTFINLWELEPYLKFSKDYDIDVTVIRAGSKTSMETTVPNEVIKKQAFFYEPLEGEINYSED